jgi:hypothetical protein
MGIKDVERRGPGENKEVYNAAGEAPGESALRGHDVLRVGAEHEIAVRAAVGGDGDEQRPA